MLSVPMPSHSCRSVAQQWSSSASTPFYSSGSVRRCVLNVFLYACLSTKLIASCEVSTSQTPSHASSTNCVSTFIGSVLMSGYAVTA